jgi:hypothetical protein
MSIVGPPGGCSYPAYCIEPFLSLALPPDWLVELHQKLWGKMELLDQIIRTVTLNVADFIDLQIRLDSLHPSRGSNNYMPQNVLGTKSGFLRSKESLNSPLSAQTKTYSDCNPTSSSGSTNSPFIFAGDADIDGLVDPPESTVDANDLDDLTPNTAGSPAKSSQSIIPASVRALADKLLGEIPNIFPQQIRYMDLTALGIKHEPRVPMMMLIRSEWETLADVIIGDRLEGLHGSVVLTGQPGIGQHP